MSFVNIFPQLSASLPQRPIAHFPGNKIVTKPDAARHTQRAGWPLPGRLSIEQTDGRQHSHGKLTLHLGASQPHPTPNPPPTSPAGLQLSWEVEHEKKLLMLLNLNAMGHMERSYSWGLPIDFLDLVF